MGDEWQTIHSNSSVGSKSQDSEWKKSGFGAQHQKSGLFRLNRDGWTVCNDPHRQWENRPYRYW